MCFVLELYPVENSLCFGFQSRADSVVFREKLSLLFESERALRRSSNLSTATLFNDFGSELSNLSTVEIENRNPWNEIHYDTPLMPIAAIDLNTELEDESSTLYESDSSYRLSGHHFGVDYYETLITYTDSLAATTQEATKLVTHKALPAIPPRRAHYLPSPESPETNTSETSTNVSEALFMPMLAPLPSLSQLALLPEGVVSANDNDDEDDSEVIDTLARPGRQLVEANETEEQNAEAKMSPREASLSRQGRRVFPPVRARQNSRGGESENSGPFASLDSNPSLARQGRRECKRSTSVGAPTHAVTRIRIAIACDTDSIPDRDLLRQGKSEERRFVEKKAQEEEEKRLSNSMRACDNFVLEIETRVAVLADVVAVVDHLKFPLFRDLIVNTMHAKMNIKKSAELETYVTNIETLFIEITEYTTKLNNMNIIEDIIITFQQLLLNQLTEVLTLIPEFLDCLKKDKEFSIQAKNLDLIYGKLSLLSKEIVKVSVDSMKDEINNKRVEYCQELLESKRNLLRTDLAGDLADVQKKIHDKADGYI
jgi:hypothetical protein